MQCNAYISRLGTCRCRSLGACSCYLWERLWGASRSASDGIAGMSSLGGLCEHLSRSPSDGIAGLSGSVSVEPRGALHTLSLACQVSQVTASISGEPQGALQTVSLACPLSRVSASISREPQGALETVSLASLGASLGSPKEPFRRYRCVGASLGSLREPFRRYRWHLWERLC